MTCCLQLKIQDDAIIASLARENIALKDKVAGLEETARLRQEWLDKAKRAAGAHYNTSFDDVWAEALAALKEKRAQKSTP